MGQANHAPAFHAALHALELGVKAALATKMPAVPRTHNVGGLFALQFRSQVGETTCRRINALVQDYDAPRYPDWEPPADIEAQVEFIRRFLRDTLPELTGRRAR